MKWRWRLLTLAVILAIEAAIGDWMLTTNPTGSTEPPRLTVVGADQTMCDDMGGQFDGLVCRDVDY